MYRCVFTKLIAGGILLRARRASNVGCEGWGVDYISKLQGRVLLSVCPQKLSPTFAARATQQLTVSCLHVYSVYILR